MVCVPALGFLLALALFLWKRFRFLAIYAALIPACAAWGALIGLLHYPSLTNSGTDVVLGFVSGAAMGSALGAATAFGLNRLGSHA